MKEKINRKTLKEKILFASIICLLFVSCGGGGGGGGGGSTNLPIRPDYSMSNVPKKDTSDNTSVPNEQDKAYNPILPKTPKDKQELELNDEPNKKEIDSLLPKVPEEKKELPDNIQGNFKKLREILGEERFKSTLLESRSKSSEAIPTDSRNLNGSGVKVVILDSDFTKNKIRLTNIYSNIEVLDKIPQTGPNTKEHGEKVLGVLREKSSIGIIAASIGKTGDSAEVIPNEASYKKALEKFNKDQKVKIFNQSFGSGKEMVDEIFSSNQYREGNRIAALAPGQENINAALAEGRKIFDFYNETIRTMGGLFVWAAGNKNELEKNMYNASIQAGLPKYYRELEEGWISVVGIDSKNQDGIMNTHRNNRMAYAGEAAWWSISADYSSPKGGIGSSYAAPRVSRAAALVSEKFPWMTNDQVRQTLFTTTDETEVGNGEKVERRLKNEPDSKYGWGMLNTERALKGPGSFVNILYQYRHNSNSKNIFNANIPAGVTSYFENDIYGNGGLEKLGDGTLHLTGNNSYKRGSTVSNGTLEIHKIHAEKIEVKEKGTLVLHSRAIIGYENDPFIKEVDEDNIKPSNIISKNVENYGTVKFVGNGTVINGKQFKGTAIIGGDYIAYPSSNTELDFDSNVAVFGKIDMKGKVGILSDKYVAGTLSKTLMTAKEVKGEIEEVLVEGMKKADVKVTGGDLVVELSRQNPVDYLGNTEASSMNVAQNVENVFVDLDEKVKAGTASQEELAMAATMQTMSVSTFSAATEKMSGEIYASAQALTFSQAQNINRDLSNRLAGLDNLKLTNGESQTWFSAIGSDGKLRRDGYASADTRVAGGQFGLDKKINSNTNLGVALAYSHATADFNRYAGNSKSDMVGVSLYGKQEWANNFYVAGRLGISHVSTKVERELIDGTGSTVQGRVKHDDIMSSVYLEVGKSFKWLTPFVGYSQDYLRRGSFSESNAAWGIHADSKNYWNSNFLVGLRAEFALNKYKFQTYITQAINVGKRDLSYEGHFTGSTVKQRYQGVKQARNTTWLGLGVFREVTTNFGIYGNVDFRMEDDKRVDSVFSAGLQYKF